MTQSALLQHVIHKVAYVSIKTQIVYLRYICSIFGGRTGEKKQRLYSMPCIKDMLLEKLDFHKYPCNAEISYEIKDNFVIYRNFRYEQHIHIELDDNKLKVDLQ